MNSNVDKLKDAGLLKDGQELSEEHKKKIEAVAAEDVDHVIRLVNSTRDEGGALPNYY